MKLNIAFSIITVTLNAKAELEKTIKSIQKQNYKNFIHIIKDGLSQDKTNEMDFSKYKNIKFIENKDDGVYDAMNQAIDYVENEFIIYLNSGDTFYSKETLKYLAEKINSNPNYYIYVGGTIQIDRNSKKIKRLIGKSNLYKYLPLSQLPHPSFVIRKSILRKLEIPFDPNLKIASDYKQQLILRKKNLWKVLYLKKILSVMPLGGISNKNKNSILEGYKETFIFSYNLFKFFSIYIIFIKILLNLYSRFYFIKQQNN